MALRCLLFSSDEGAAEPICQVLAGLGVEAEPCSEGVAAVERVTSQSFQIVIIDWDQQPEAGFLLKTARERKASERPLTLAIVSDDASVPKALQAGANSILRKPIIVNHVNDTLTTARDLLRAKHETATNLAQAAAAGASASVTTTLPASTEQITEHGNEKPLRAGEFLHSSGTNPGGQFHTESDTQRALEESAVEAEDPLKELEPVAGSVAEEKPAPPPPPSSNEPRGLQWYLNARAGTLPPIPTPVSSPPEAPAKPELLGFEQTLSYSETAAGPDEVADEPSRTGLALHPPSDHAPSDHPPTVHTPTVHASSHSDQHEQKAEAKLFAYIAGEGDEAEETPRASFRLGKGAIISALALAACAIVAAPQAPWHPQARALWGRGQQLVHGWLNPQLVTTQQAPAAHEDFGRAGDEYKLPVAENIPDATTDPSQIHVVPMVDPTAKKPTNGATTDPTAGPGDATGANPSDPAQPSTGPAQASPTTQTSTDPTQTASGPATGATAAPPGSSPGSSPASAPAQAPSTTPSVSVPVEQPRADTPTPDPVSAAPATTQPVPQKNPQPHNVSTVATNAIPSSLKSQMASMAPEASGNKAPESALPSIEPVVLPELTVRALLTDQPAVDYPATAKGQQGMVVLQVLIGRDGTVQDAKFMQGSLAFARTAIDGVKQWKFKPYLMNGRAASVQTTLTMSFKPGS